MTKSIGKFESHSIQIELVKAGSKSWELHISSIGEDRAPLLLKVERATREQVIRFAQLVEPMLDGVKIVNTVKAML